MAIPDVTLTVKNGGLAVSPSDTDRIHVLLGVCSTGATNVFQGFGSIAAMRTALGVGPLVECGAYEMALDGGPMYFVPVNPSVSGVNGSVYLSGANGAKTSVNDAGTSLVWSYQPSSGSQSTSSVTHTGTGLATVTPSGTPVAPYGVLIKIVATGTATTATFQYSLDGGISFSGVVTSVASYTLGSTGLTLAMSSSSGNFIAGDTYAFTSVPHAPLGTGTITLSGTPIANPPSNPLGAYDVVVKIIATGAIGTATLTYSLDGGLTFPFGTITTAATMAIAGTGLTLNLSGSFTATDRYQSLAVATSGAGTGSVAVSGSPLDQYSVQVTIAASGVNLAAATGTFTYSLDGGISQSPVFAIPSGGVFTVPGTGMTLTFANGVGTGTSFNAGDIYVFYTLSPGFQPTDLTPALNAALASSTGFSYLHVVGSASTAAGSATIAAVVSSALDTAAMNHNYLFGIVDGANDSDANLESAFASFFDFRVMVAAGYETLTSAITGMQLVRSAGWVASARLGQITISTDPAAFALGPLNGVDAILRDERVTPALDANRFTTLRTFPQAQGFFVTNGNMMESAGGDFQLVQYVRVINKACKVAFLALLQYLSAKLRVNAASVRPPLVPGGIDERDARAIENFVDAQLNGAIIASGDAVSATTSVDRTVNLLSTSDLVVAITIVPDGYAKEITATIGFSNPAITL